MIEFKKIRYKNFLSTGNTFTEITLNEHEITAIIGKNGDGKSTFMDAICFALFNKPFRNVNKDQVVNSINRKNCVTELDFTINETDYTVIRGHKPREFKVIKDGVELPQDSNAWDQQSWFEQKILGFSKPTFCQIVLLGSTSFIPFMRLDKNDRRKVIEDLLDLDVFSKMNKLLEEKTKDLKEDSKSTKESLNVNIAKLEGHRKLLDNMEANKAKEITDLEAQREQAKTDGKNRASNLQTIRNRISEAEKEYANLQCKDSEKKEIGKELSVLKYRSSEIQQRLKTFEDVDECPTCKQIMPNKEAIMKEWHSDLTSLLEQEKTTRKVLDKLQEEIDFRNSVNSKLTKKKQESAKVEGELTALMKQMETLRIKIEELKTTKIDTNTEGVRQSIEETEKQVNRLSHLYETQLKLLSLYEQAKYLLKDTGIKATIIETYIPTINTLITKYLNEMDFHVRFEIDNNFNETIKSRHRDEFSYSSFSEGEKMRIDMALLFTWRAVARLKNSIKTNLLIIDEIFDGSLDAEGIECIIKLLHGLEDSNVFLISHKNDVISDKFTNILRFEKQNNFSIITDS